MSVLPVNPGSNIIEAVKTAVEVKSGKSFHDQLLDAIPKIGTEKASSLSAARLFKYAQGNVIRPEDIKKELYEDITAFKKAINRVFNEQGIDKTYPVELDTDEAGFMRVINEHPDKDKIEAIFAGNFELRNLCVKINGFTEMLESIPETAAFQKAYAANPKVAVAQFSYLFGENHMNRFYTSLQPHKGVWSVNIMPTEPFIMRYKPHSSEDFVAQELVKEDKYLFAGYF